MKLSLVAVDAAPRLETSAGEVSHQRQLPAVNLWPTTLLLTSILECNKNNVKNRIKEYLYRNCIYWLLLEDDIESDLQKKMHSNAVKTRV